MMPLIQTVTLADRLHGIGAVVFMSAVVFAIAKVIHIAIAWRDTRKWIHGEPICWWASGMYFLGSIYGLVNTNHGLPAYGPIGTTYGPIAAMGAIGMVLGIYIGLLHGGRRIDRMFPLKSVPAGKIEENEERSRNLS